MLEKFQEELDEEQNDNIKKVVKEYIVDLKKNKEPKNGGFPNSEKMIKALIEVIKFKFDDLSSKTFDALSEEYAARFGQEVSDKLDLDPETLEWMRKAREEEEKKMWMRGDQAHNPHHFEQN